MKPTTRRTLAAVVTGVAAAVGVAATPAAAARAVPVPVPLGGAEAALGMELPEVAGELPVPTAGAPEGPRYVEGRLLPERTLPQLPVRAGLPGVDVRPAAAARPRRRLRPRRCRRPRRRAAHPGAGTVPGRPAHRAEPRGPRPAVAQASRGRRARPGGPDGSGGRPGRRTGPVTLRRPRSPARSCSEWPCGR
ncbi:hypothetical protein SLI_3050 [Streptomyces lividans 1326]|uniref:Secreted protein n=1 Tax=Streptomyces lividans 1326 TaxID=1200984 RepID=A0A7U9HBH4_STRLI|nr:hypothetical protein SLI_3050 [Streptomyces lividans 1326]